VRGDSTDTAGKRLVTDLRQFEISTEPQPKATIAISAKIINGAGQVKTARIIEKSAPLDGLAPGKAVAAFNRAFDELARDLIVWVASVR
jgi:phospholipid/cholesterol/gamma-HCH transport system substrate-binding protein